MNSLTAITDSIPAHQGVCRVIQLLFAETNLLRDAFPATVASRRLHHVEIDVRRPTGHSMRAASSSFHASERTRSGMSARSRLHVVSTLALMTAFCSPVPAEEFELEPGFVSMFNGKDLSGWQFSGKSWGLPPESPGNGWSVADGVEFKEFKGHAM